MLKPNAVGAMLILVDVNLLAADPQYLYHLLLCFDSLMFK